MILQTRYIGNQSPSLPTPIPVFPTFHGMSWEEVEEAEDDYHQMWHFYYIVLFAAHHRSCLRMLAEDAVAAEDEMVGVSYVNEESSSSDRTMDDSEVIVTVTVDKPAAPSGRDGGLHAGIETGQFFRTLVGPGGNIVHYQVSFLDQWKRSMDIGDDIDIAYYNGTGAERVMNALKSCPGQLNGNVFEMMRVCEAFTQKWRDGVIARQFVADDVLKYYKRPWCDHLVMVRGNCMQVPGDPALGLIYKNFNEKSNPKAIVDTSSLFDVVSREGNELNKVLGELGIRREKRLNSVVEKLSVAWKSVAKMLKVAAANHAEYEAEKAYLAEHLKERTALCGQLQKEKVLQKEQFEKEEALQKDQFEKEAAATKKEVEDEAKKAVDIVEVVRLRGKVIELEKALSRARDSINRTQQVHNKFKYERRLHKLNFDNIFKELFELQCRYGKIKIERDEVLRKESDRFALFQKFLKNKQFTDESDKLECHRSLLSLALHFEVEVDSERGLKEAYLELLTERAIVPDQLW
ncbi:hypothetical protein GIB67_004977 [Kingdonia uniflora]|uniref:Uncharacterized protein n=1 Tax=Kingdonia uniflora TaxID=39325 RepID=A0A7J7NML5_9MAGN|nr:hypothetical protein GIB67_004977 [Kingdonia uniflora]